MHSETLQRDAQTGTTSLVGSVETEVIDPLNRLAECGSMHT